MDKKWTTIILHRDVKSILEKIMRENGLLTYKELMLYFIDEYEKNKNK